MRQVLFEVFGHSIHAYAAMISVSFVLGTLLTVREAEKQDLWIAPEAGLWVFVGALFGAKLFYIIQYDPFAEVLGEVWHRHAWRAIFIWRAGVVYYGGLFGGVAAALLYGKVNRIPLLKGSDLVFPFLAMGQAITRVGCFLNGCCYGYPTEMPWGVRFPAWGHCFRHQVNEKLIMPNAVTSLPVHPTQLYMVAGLAVIFIVLLRTLRHKRFDGQVVLGYAFFYGVLRFVVEFFRGDSARSMGGMTVSQTISLAMIAVGLFFLVITLKRGLWKQAPASPATTAAPISSAPEDQEEESSEG